MRAADVNECASAAPYVSRACLPCGLQGSLDAADHLKRKLGVDFNETTADGRFMIKESECLGACAMAPVILVNNKKMHDYMTNEKLDQLIVFSVSDEYFRLRRVLRIAYRNE